MSRKQIFAVVGGGASGIAATYFLTRRGVEVDLIEQDAQLGGRISPCRLGDAWIQIGGRNIGTAYKLFREFTAAMGENDYIAHGQRTSRVRNGQLGTLDHDHPFSGLTNLLRRFSPRDIIRFLRLCAAVKVNEENGYLGGAYFNRLSKRLGHSPVSAYFGEEFSETLIRAMSVTSNGAEPDEVYVGNLGANIRMIFDRYERLSDGILPVLEKFSRIATVRLNTRVESILRRNGRGAGLCLSGEDGIEERPYDGIVIATPASGAARLVEPLDAPLAEVLGQVRYYPLTMIVVEYARDILPEAFGNLVFDSQEPISSASALSPTQRNFIRYTFSGRTARQYLDAGADSEALIDLAEETLNKHFPVHADERVEFLTKRFAAGLCAYTPDHDHFTDQVDAGLRNLNGLYLTGDYLQGTSIEACFRAAKRCVDHALAHRSD